MSLTDMIVGSFIGGAVMLLFFFVKEYFKGRNGGKVNDLDKKITAIETNMKNMEKDISRNEGSIKTLTEGSDKYHKKVTRAQMELESIWRIIDPPGRLSDRSHNDENEDDGE